MTGRAAPKPLVLVAACVLVDGQGRILISQRPAGKSLAGLWEFPGGKLEEGETPEHALTRELEEELGITLAASNLMPLTFSSFSYPDFQLLMPVFACWAWRNEIAAREGQALAWVDPAALHDYAMPPADEPLKSLLPGLLATVAKNRPRASR